MKTYRCFDKYENAGLIDLAAGEKCDAVTTVTLSQYRAAPIPGVLVGLQEESDGEVRLSLAPKKHTMIIGCTGTGKTQYLMSTIELMMMNREHFLFTDPKKENLIAMGGKLIAAGYKVIVLNLSGGSIKTDFYNTMHVVYMKRMEQIRIEDQVSVKRLDNGEYVYCFLGREYGCEADLHRAILRRKSDLQNEIDCKLDEITTTICPACEGKDASWHYGARSALRGIIYGMLEDIEDNPKRRFPLITEDTFNLETVMRIFSSFGDNADSYDAGYFKSRPKDSRARRAAAKTVLIEAKVTRDGYMGVLNDHLSVFLSPAFRYINLASTVDFKKDLDGDQPLAIFLCTNEEQRGMDEQVSFMVSRIYEEILEYIRERNDRPLDTTFNFCLDEFGNISKLDFFRSALTMGRARNLYFTILVQSYSQLDNLYGKEEAETIRENICQRIFFGTPDYDTKRRFSDEAGQRTVLGLSSVYGGSGPHITNCSFDTVRVLPISFFSSMRNGQCVVITDNADAMLSRVQFHYSVRAFHEGGFIENPYLEEYSDEIYLGDPTHSYSIL